MYASFSIGVELSAFVQLIKICATINPHLVYVSKLWYVVPKLSRGFEYSRSKTSFFQIKPVLG